MKGISIGCVAFALLAVACDEEEAEPEEAKQAAGSEAPPSASAAPAASAKPEGAKASEEAAGDGFEGEIEVAIESEKADDSAPDSLTFLVKGDRVRMELPEGATDAETGKVAQIIDLGDGTMVSLVEKKKVAMEMGFDQLEKQTAQWGGSAEPKAKAAGEPAKGAEPKLTKTERTATIAGRECRYWDVTHDGERSSVCLADEAVFELPAEVLPPWSTELFGEQRFPLQIVNYDASGKKAHTIEVTRMEEKPVPDSAFEVPPGYRRVNLANMMKGMMPGMVGAGNDPGESQMPSKKQLEEAQNVLRQMQQKHEAQQ